MIATDQNASTAYDILASSSSEFLRYIRGLSVESLTDLYQMLTHPKNEDYYNSWGANAVACLFVERGWKLPEKA